jgi:hypothetical protein
VASKRTQAKVLGYSPDNRLKIEVSVRDVEANYPILRKRLEIAINGFGGDEMSWDGVGREGVNDHQIKRLI